MRPFLVPLYLVFIFGFFPSFPRDLSAPASAAEEEGGAEASAAGFYGANGLYNRKLYALAAEEYASFLEEHPAHEKAAQAKLGLALCHAALGQAEKALPLLEELSSRGAAGIEDAREVYNLLGRCLLMLGRAEDAARAYGQSLARGGQGAARLEARVGSVEAQYRLGRWEELLQGCKGFEAEFPGSEQTGRIRFQGAVALFETGRFDQAAAALQGLGELDEDCPFRQHATFLLAESLRELGRIPEAEQAYEKAARRMEGAFTAEALFRLGYVRFTDGREAEAAADFAELLAKQGASPNAPAAKLYLGRCMAAMKDYESAARLFESFPASSPEYGRARLWLGRTLRAGGKLAEAERVFAGASEEVRDEDVRPDLLFALGEARMDLESFDRAAEAFEKLERDYPGNARGGDALRLLCFSLHRSGAFDQSLARCETFRSRFPQDPCKGEVDFLRAENLFMMNRTAEAKDAFAAFFEERPSDGQAPSARFRLAQIAYEAEGWEEALALLQPLEAGPPLQGAFFAPLRYIAGDCLFHLERWSEAAQDFLAFLDAQPRHAFRDAAALKAALALERGGRADQAAAMLSSYESRFSSGAYAARAWIELGRLQYEAGRLTPARASFEKACARERSPEALYYLGYIALAEEKPAEALDRFGALLKEHPDHELTADALLQQGVILLRQDDFAGAKEALDLFLARRPDDPQAEKALFYSGIASSRQDRFAEAAACMERLLAEHPSFEAADRALYEWAWCERGLNRPEGARAHYEALLRGYPKSPLHGEALYELAEMDFDAKDYASASGRLEELLRDGADGALKERVLYRLGWCLFSREDMAGAAERFEEMLSEFPLSEQAEGALYQAGEARLALKEFEPAYRHFKELADRKGGGLEEQALLRLGETAALAGRWQESENAFRNFERAFPKSPHLDRALFGQAWALENRGKYTEAIGAYGRLVDRGRFDEIEARSQFQVGECHFALKRYDEAVKALVKVEVLYAYPDWSAKALLETARALEAPGRLREAGEQYAELIQKYPDSEAAEVARRGLAELKRKEGADSPR